MPNIQTDYRFHVYSHNQGVQRRHRSMLPERIVLDHVTRLQRAWDRDTGSLGQVTEEERRSDFADDLLRKKAVYVLAEHIPSGEMVGYGQMVEEVEADEIVPLLSLAYVLRAHREKGILGGITRKIIDAARTRGYETLTTEPGSDGKAESVFKAIFRETGPFQEIRDEDGVTLKLDLTRGPGEGNGQTPGTTDRSRR